MAVGFGYLVRQGPLAWCYQTETTIDQQPDAAGAFQIDLLLLEEQPESGDRPVHLYGREVLGPGTGYSPLPSIPDRPIED